MFRMEMTEFRIERKTRVEEEEEKNGKDKGNRMDMERSRELIVAEMDTKYGEKEAEKITPRNKLGQWAGHTEEGVDGILVSIGLCIIALLLCVVMKDALSSFIINLVQSMTTQAQQILNGSTPIVS